MLQKSQDIEDKNMHALLSVFTGQCNALHLRDLS